MLQKLNGSLSNLGKANGGKTWLEYLDSPFRAILRIERVTQRFSKVMNAAGFAAAGRHRMKAFS